MRDIDASVQGAATKVGRARLNAPPICASGVWGTQSVIIKTTDGREIDTARDLTGPERHILQKLFAWRSMADSLAQFREKTHGALARGWNNSGPVKMSPMLAAVIRDMEKKVSERLDTGEPSG
jgi:hypothetical protein